MEKVGKLLLYVHFLTYFLITPQCQTLKLLGVEGSRMCTDLSCRAKPVPGQAGAGAPTSPEMDDNDWSLT